MQKKHKYGLIGYPLEHSFSPGYFSAKFLKEGIENADYQLYPLPNIRDFKKLPIPSFSGLNVTIPYKQKIIPYLDELDPIAAEIGAVNTILIQENRLKGYNTDAFGFEHSLLQLISIDKILPEKALVLGRGGSSRAIRYVLKKLGIKFRSISRKNKKWNYQNIDEEIIESHPLIINTTPLGMHPHTDQYPSIPYTGITSTHFLFDLIYNPEKTVFLKKGLSQGARVKNGLEMLHLQAEKSWEIWNSKLN